MTALTRAAAYVTGGTRLCHGLTAPLPDCPPGTDVTVELTPSEVDSCNCLFIATFRPTYSPIVPPPSYIG